MTCIIMSERVVARDHYLEKYPVVERADLPYFSLGLSLLPMPQGIHRSPQGLRGSVSASHDTDLLEVSLDLSLASQLTCSKRQLSN